MVGVAVNVLLSLDVNNVCICSDSRSYESFLSHHGFTLYHGGHLFGSFDNF